MDIPISLYTFGTPNGQKTNIMMEELGIKYELKVVDITKGEQKQDWYLKINPNGRIPAIVDHEEGDFAVFESGAILLYLAEKYQKFIPSDKKGRSEAIQWIMWQMGGLGPMQGQAGHFMSNPEGAPIKYAQDRYRNETKRLLSVLEDGLKGQEYLAGGMYTIADICSFTWVMYLPGLAISLDEFPNVKAWRDRIYAREAVKKGLDIPSEFRLKEAYQDPEKMKEKFLEAEAKLAQ